MDVSNNSSGHLQDCANGVNTLVAEGKLDEALKVAVYLQRAGQLAILEMARGKLKDFFPKVTALLDALGNSNIESHPRLRHTVAKTARVFTQLAVHRMEEPFSGNSKKELLEKIAPRLKDSKVGKQYALRFELTCLEEAVKGIETGISTVNVELIKKTIKGVFEFAVGGDPSTLCGVAKKTFHEMGKIWYADALRFSWIGQMGKNDEPTFKFFLSEVQSYVDERCLFKGLKKRHVFIGLVDTFAEIAWTSKIDEHRRLAALWIARLAGEHQKRIPLKAVRYRAVEQLMALEGHHVDSFRKLAALHLDSLERLPVVGNENTGYRERPKLVLSRAEIEDLLTSDLERGVAEVKKTSAETIKELRETKSDVKELKEIVLAMYSRQLTTAELAVSIIQLQAPLPKFTGREEKIEDIRSFFLDEGVGHHDPCKVVYIHGIGGIGKTELALRFADDFKSSFAFVYTIPGESAEARAGAYRQLAKELRLPLEEKEAPDAVRKKLFAHLESADFKKPYLLLYDNVDEELPLPQRNGCLLMTARSWEHFPEELEYHDLELEPMGQEESVALLSRHTGEEPSAAMLQLADRLCGYPLALAQAGAYISANPLRSVSKYLVMGSESKVSASRNRYKETSDQVLSTSFEALAKENPQAFDWLRICSYFNPDHIPEAYLQMIVPDEIEREKVANALRRFGLMRCGQGSFSLHRIVQQALQERDVDSLWMKNACLLLDHVIFDFNTCEDFEGLQTGFTVWATHAEALLQFGDALPKRSRAALLLKMSTFEAEILFRYPKALRYAEEGAEILVELDGGENRNAVVALNRFGNIYFRMGRYSEALDSFSRSLDLQKKIGAPPLEISASLNNIANVLYRLEKYEEALKRAKEAYAIDEQVLERTDPRLAFSCHSIGNILDGLEHWEEALKWYEQSRGIWLKHYGTEMHPRVAQSLDSIGHVLRSVGNYDEALRVHERTVVVWKKFEMKPELAACWSNMGCCFMQLRRFEEAMEKHECALKLQIELVGEQGAAVGNCWRDIAVTWKKSGQRDRALSCFRKAHSIFRRALGDEHPLVHEMATYIRLMSKKSSDDRAEATLIKLIRVGQSLHESGEYREALEKYEEAVSIVDGSRRKRSPEVGLCYVSMAQLLLSLGEQSEALEKYKKALAILDLRLELKTEYVARAHFEMGMLYYALGKSQNAHQALNRAEELYKQLPGNHEKAVGEIAVFRVRIYANSGFRLFNGTYRCEKLEELEEPEEEEVQARGAGGSSLVNFMKFSIVVGGLWVAALFAKDYIDERKRR